MQETPVPIPPSERSAGEGIGYPLQYSWAFLVAQQVEHLPAMQETWVGSLGWEDPLEKRTATHSSILAQRMPWTEEPGRLQTFTMKRGFLGGASGKEPACQCRRYKRCGFDPWVRKIPWRRARQPTSVFLPGESHGQRSPVGYSP